MDIVLHGGNFDDLRIALSQEIFAMLMQTGPLNFSARLKSEYLQWYLYLAYNLPHDFGGKSVLNVLGWVQPKSYLSF